MISILSRILVRKDCIVMGIFKPAYYNDKNILRMRIAALEKDLPANIKYSFSFSGAVGDRTEYGEGEQNIEIWSSAE